MTIIEADRQLADRRNLLQFCAATGPISDSDARLIEAIGVAQEVIRLAGEIADQRAFACDCGVSGDVFARLRDLARRE